MINSSPDFWQHYLKFGKGFLFLSNLSDKSKWNRLKADGDFQYAHLYLMIVK